MSNDLISRSAVINLIESKLTDGYLLLGGDKPMVDASEIIEDISDLPTAYDMDNVMEKLENEAKRWEESGMQYEDKKELGVAEGYRRAIKIVKTGIEG